MTLALSKEELLNVNKKSDVSNDQKDKRNLYLLREGGEVVIHKHIHRIGHIFRGIQISRIPVKMNAIFRESVLLLAWHVYN